MNKAPSLPAFNQARDVPLSGFLLFAAFFFGIPLTICLVIGTRWLDDHEREGAQRRSIHLERILAEFDVQTRPDDLLLECIRQQFRGIPLERNPLKEWNDARKRLKRSFGPSIGFIWTTPEGEFDPMHSDVDAPPDLIRSFFQDQHLLMMNQKGGFSRNAVRYRRFFGPLLGRGREQLWNRLILTSFRGAFERVYISDWVPGKSQFIVLLRPNPDWNLLITRQMVDLLRKEYPEARFRLQRVRSRTPSDPNLDRILALSGARAETFLAWKNRIWGQMEVAPGIHLIVSIPDENDPWILETRKQLWEGAFVLGAVFVVAGWFILLARGVPWVSIRVKLGILFTYVIAFPLTLLLFSTQGLLGERAELIIAGIHQDHEKMLRNFDRRFIRYLGRIEVGLQNLLEQPISPGNIGKIEASRRLARTIDLCRPEMCVLIDEKGGFAFKEISDKFVPLFRVVSIVRHGIRGLISDLNKTTEAIHPGSEMQFAGATAEYFGLDIDLLFSELSRNLGFLNEFTGNNSRLLTFLAPVREFNGTVRYIAMIAWRADLMQWRYVQTAFGKAISRVPATEGLAMSENARESWPADKPLKAEFQPLSMPLRNLVLPITARKSRSKKDSAVTGINGSQLSRYQLFAVSPIERFSGELKAIRGRYGLLCAVFLLIGVAAGGYLARFVLEPIGFVSEGVRAIAERRFDLRIPVLADDELGRLSMAFNNLLANTKDLELARVIQESFFPAGSAALSGWEVHGACIPATHVGGDFFFYRVVSDHQLLMLVGDVSGHGVSAALVVAMARALVTHPDTGFQPEQVLMTMQKVFAQTLNRRKMMTCFAALFDTRSGMLKVANAGHNYPCLIRGTSATGPELIEASGMPLGSRQRFPFEPVERQLHDGDWILFYTDGLIEALDREGDSIGYHRLVDVLPALKRKTAAVTTQAVQDWFFGRTVPGPLPDDVTVVVFQREAQEEGVQAV